MNSCGKSSKKSLRKSRFLRNRRSFILITVLCMGIGFAYLTTNLTITGNTGVSGNSWNIYFTNIQETDGSVDATVVPTTSGTNTTSIDYTVILDKPGDFYEFTVDAVNNGTINAMIQNINMTSLDADVAKYISYTATYEDGTPLAQNDVLKKNKTSTYKIRVEFKKNISEDDLSEEDNSLTLTFGVNYNLSPEPIESKFIKLVKDSAVLDTNINFGNISSSSNGKGLYIRNGTEDDNYPIYYYRGSVTNNNAKFAGFCWKIVRTTETGGTKLIYNGVPNASGGCTNTTGTATQATSVSNFNERSNSPAYNGYMYGTPYEDAKRVKYSSFKYASVATYNTETKTYLLSEIVTSDADSTHHYTCFSSSTSCSSVYYVYYSGSQAIYITLTDGKTLDEAFAEMNTNSNNSTVKTAVDNWFNNTFKTYFTVNNKEYNDYLEDTVWCNDRSVDDYGGFNPNGGNTHGALSYNASKRAGLSRPTLVCSNKSDSFTVEESDIGNGDLIYPVGLLTIDEIILAGGTVAFENSNYYLYTYQKWWTMSPVNFYYDGGGGSGASWQYIVYINGNISTKRNVYGDIGVRPSISLKPTVKIASGGDGTSSHPYEFLVD